MALEDAKNEVDTAFTRTERRGYAFENAFGGATSFLRRTYTKDLTGVDLAITGVPFDQAVSHRSGTRCCWHASAFRDCFPPPSRSAPAFAAHAPAPCSPAAPRIPSCRSSAPSRRPSA